MDQDRRARLRELLIADRDGESASTVALVCGRCVKELSITGAGATVLSHLGIGSGSADHPSRGLVHATNPTSAGLEDLQLTVGEGPCLDAFASGGPVLVPDLAAEGARWPAFTPGALALGAAAVFSFPLQVGVARLGSLDLYRGSPGSLSRSEMSDALILTDMATHGISDELAGHHTADMSWLLDPHVEVYQAAGMAQVQLETTTETALLRLRGYAFAHDLPLAEVARRVVTRRLRFTQEEDWS
ncbi:GAF and ANTAR domain-containing protein [Lentzea sp. NPDC051208]|uniref:GAF and ANTAR domain-containing protein n=1 Tax=Lentzea sp. NPDC051208 TaxID=3154642 RepID=UPI0034161E21